MTPRLLSLLLALALLTGCGASDDDDRPAPPAERSSGEAASLADVPELYDELQPSVVAVQVRTAQGAGEGSGVVYRKRHIVTNNHVVAGGREIEVALASGERLPAEIVARDPRTDLAVLSVERDLPPAAFAQELPRIGSLALAIGNPLGFEGSITAGIVSGLDRAIPSQGQTPSLVNLLQTDAPISPGNSGGALVGADGQVIGINVAYIPPQARAVSIGFAIPSPTVIDVADELIEDGEVEHAYLGVQIGPLTPRVAEALGVEAETGAVIERVEPGSPAAGAGLRPGDVVVEAGGEPVEQLEDVHSVLRRTDPGQDVALTVVRRGDRRDVNVATTQRPGE